MINKIPNNLKEFDTFIEYPFCIFEKKNLLSRFDYNQLRNKFPSEELFPGYHENGSKIFLNNKHNEFYKFIKGNIWNDFYNLFNNKDLISFLIKLISPQLKSIGNRKSFKNFYFKKKYSNNFYHKMHKKLLRLINCQIIRLGFEFSIIKKDCYIPPHCDTENKLLSLMIYFPPENKSNSFDKEMGTNFYKQKDEIKKNLDIWESKYLNIDDSKIFFENYDNFFQSKFEENKLVGFIKNDKSWHDVSEFNQDVFRKSLNINLYIE